MCGGRAQGPRAQYPKRADHALGSTALVPSWAPLHWRRRKSPWDTYRDPNPGPPAPPGLLRLEELVRGFLISKETLSVRMLDDSRDPTPLLKEIRDDKMSTIIIDANASISHLILRKVSPPVSVSLQGWGRSIG